NQIPLNNIKIDGYESIGYIAKSTKPGIDHFIAIIHFEELSLTIDDGEVSVLTDQSDNPKIVILKKI
ncbi:MAG: hypothetical protein ACOVOR_00045, partial [Rhabdochlamydiaceae bacterium]